MCLESQPLYSGGRRVYSDFSSGKWLEQTQVQHIGHTWALVTCSAASLSDCCVVVVVSYDIFEAFPLTFRQLSEVDYTPLQTCLALCFTQMLQKPAGISTNFIHCWCT